VTRGLCSRQNLFAVTCALLLFCRGTSDFVSLALTRDSSDTQLAASQKIKVAGSFRWIAESISQIEQAVILGRTNRSDITPGHATDSLNFVLGASRHALD
jgi:hypothetical protein